MKKYNSLKMEPIVIAILTNSGIASGSAHHFLKEKRIPISFKV